MQCGKNGADQGGFKMVKRFVAGVLLAASACTLLLSVIHTQQLQQEIAGKVIRFHVRANSDSAADQLLKLEVRDAIGSLMAEKLKDADSRLESCQIVEENLEEICAAAGETIREKGYDYPVSASLGDSDFPEKHYGMLTFPAGDYEALNVKIGSGQGHNWWCVLYPNLCFSGSLYRTDDPKNCEKLEQVLSPKECQAVMEQKKYRIRFRLLDAARKLTGTQTE